MRSSALGAAGEQTGLVAATGVWEPHAGADVAGTINGVTATGNGQALIAPPLDPSLGGLALTVTATIPGALGTFTYIPGIAARLDQAASDAIDFGTGSITTAISSRQGRISGLDSQISNWDVRLAAREADHAPAVRRHGDRSRQPAQPEQLARRPARQPSDEQQLCRLAARNHFDPQPERDSRMNASMIRNRYVGASVDTASPARLVTMLYDRLVRDLLTAEAALAGSDLEGANNGLIHAQEVVWELAAGLDATKWSGGPALAALYQFMLDELLAANVKKDADKVISVRNLVEPLQDAWHQAAELAAAPTLAAAVSA